MKLFGLSSVDTLLVLLLLDLTSWGSVFWKQYLYQIIIRPYTVGIEYNLSTMNDFIALYVIGFLILLRLITPGFLILACLTNQVNHRGFLWMWHWATTIMDIVVLIGCVLAYVFTWQHLSYDRVEGLLLFVAFFIVFRLIYWSMSRTSLTEFSTDTGTLFPVKGCNGVFVYLQSHIQSFCEIILVWEILWGLLITTFTAFVVIASEVLDTKDLISRYALFPIWFGYPVSLDFLLSWSVLIGSISLATLQFLAIRKNWTTCLQISRILFIIVGVFGYLISHSVIFFKFYNISTRFLNQTFGVPMGIGYTVIIIGVAECICHVVIRLFLAVFIVKYINRNTSPRYNKWTKESGFKEPLLQSEKDAKRET